MNLTEDQQKNLVRNAEILSLNGQMLSLFKTGCSEKDIKERIESIQKVADSLKKSFSIE